MARWARMLGLMPLFMPAMGLVFATIDGNWEAWSLPNPRKDLAILALIMAGTALMGALIGYFQGTATLTMTPEKLTIERESGRPRTATIRWDTTRRVSVIDDNRLMVWYPDGHHPDASNFRNRRPLGNDPSLAKGDDGWLVCFLSEVTVPSNRSDQVIEIRRALARFAGDRNTVT